MLAIYKKELKSYFTSMIGYAMIAFFLIILGIYFTGFNLNGKSATLGVTLANISFVFLIVLPILTMRLISEEQRQKTDQLLFSSPIKISDVIIGKFFAVVTVFSVPILVACTMPLVLSQFGTILYIKTYSTILAFWLLGCVMLSIGLFLSSLTESQVVAAVITFGVNVFIFLMSSLAQLVPETAIASFGGFAIIIFILIALLYTFSKNILVSVVGFVALEGALIGAYVMKAELFESAMTKVLNGISFYSRFTSFGMGSFDIGSIIYYLSFIILFLFLTLQSIQKRRWS